MRKQLVGTIDQGTTSSRFLLLDVEDNWNVVAASQSEFPSIVTQPGYCEQNPTDIWMSVERCICDAFQQLQAVDYTVLAIGITNQRETTVAWDRCTGEPLSNAIVWMDTRTKDIVDRLKTPNNDKLCKSLTGLPISTYFSALKMNWLLENVDTVKKAAKDDVLCFGTIDSWLIWKLTAGQAYCTDVTNASRTLLMDINKCQWNDDLLKLFGITSSSWLPQIKSSCEGFGVISLTVCNGYLDKVKITGVLGDQQASLVGQQCFRPGQAKNTYGTGCFLLFNLGSKPILSSHGLLTTVAYKLGPTSPTIYAMEGSIATAGSAIIWLRDSLNLVETSREAGDLAGQVDDTAGLIFVPALNGLLAPYWEPNATGMLMGITHFTKRAHIIRALFEALSYQSKEIVEAIEFDAHVKLSKLKVDGGMTNADCLAQVQSNILGIDVERPIFREMTALGAAFAAGIGVGILRVDESSYCLVSNGKDPKTPHIDSNAIFKPRWTTEQQNLGYSRWKMAVQRCIMKI